ncbi:unnamed protein product [Prorocentrum cordatum]|uniref:Uncharacterized protein n=1 Tax=Prorocentrum cordatum TaxID=2364126 RepID=A0ABN9U7A4_9DINO|nr:unnamed protein product [Polarella glacialis]
MFFKAIDMQNEGDALAKEGRTKLSLKQVEDDLSTQTFFKLQKNRHFVALSLVEAEHLRAVMHLSEPGAFRQTGLAIRALGNLESVLADSLIDECGPATSSAGGVKYQLSTAEQLLRLVNCAEGFQGRELRILMRTMQHTQVPERLPWFLDIRSCRRRAQRPYQQLPIAALFLKERTSSTTWQSTPSFPG